MNANIFFPSDSVLFVGEGNFSFSLSFTERNINVSNIEVSCFEKECTAEATKKNIGSLQDAGVAVHFGIDATKLASYPAIIEKNFTCIIFNFPHVGGKMKIHKNRQLLKDFFASCVSLPQRHHQDIPRRILLSLCKGQGGTPADGEALRKWGDSWQVNEMAAMAGLVLTKVDPFDHSLCPGYSSVGYRSRDEWFHTEKALVHVLQQAPPLLVPSIWTESMVSVETCEGLIACDRTYVQYGGFTELQNNLFVLDDESDTAESELIRTILEYLQEELPDLTYVPPRELPLHCPHDSSNIPCMTDTGEMAWLRDSLCHVVEKHEPNFISRGVVFQKVSSNFQCPPCKHQAVIQYSQDINMIDLVLKIFIIIFGDEKTFSVIYDDFSASWHVKFLDRTDLRLAHLLNGELVVASFYSRTHVFDICFTEGKEFNETKLFSVLWRVLGMWLTDVKMVDHYFPENENWVSRSYRLTYRSSVEALSRKAAVTLHQSVLPELLVSSGLALKIH